jgi:hypothetical protein
MLMRAVSTAVLCFFIFGCSTSAKKVSASYVSPMQYQGYSCNQLRQEYIRVNGRVLEISGVQNAEAKKDAVAMGVGLVLFWPALFFLIGHDKSEELARLKGECDAIEGCAIEKNCALAAEIADARRQQQEQEEKLKKERVEKTPGEPWGSASSF